MHKQSTSNILLTAALVLITVSATCQRSDSAACNLKLMPVLWVQQSAEYKALCYQAFNLAQWRIECLKKKGKDKRPRAIITDIDETVLDNSYSEALNIRECRDFSPAAWKQWTEQARATAVPGAVSFLQYAKAKNITIFYLSNRDTSEITSTLKNLQALQFPDARESQMLFLSNTSSKEARRVAVMEKYNVVMLLGDNLNDFSNVFEKKPNRERNVEAEKMQAEWGKKFIVLPNPIYGEWENALLEYKRGIAPRQRLEMLKGALQQ
jgi:5'-nucleotidase (lipoprotein e(P4) family)